MSTQDSEPRLDPRFRDPVSVEASTNGGAMWGWIAGIAILILVVFVLIGGWNGADNPATRSAAPIDIGTCSMFGVGDKSGARVSLRAPTERKSRSL